MGAIFISYRREDSAGHAGRLEEALERHFGARQVFRDVDDLQPGQPFPEALRARLQAASAVIALIGPRWLSVAREGRPRLFEPDDYVRAELAQALASGVPVIPVLVGEASMPAADALPAELAPLVARHAVQLSDAGWADDVARLAAALAAHAPPRRRRRQHRWAAVAGVVALAASAGWFLSSTTPPVGAWQAQVRYAWGDVHQERFELSASGDTVVGTASFLGTPRRIEAVRWDGSQLHFTTRSEVVMGSEQRALTHVYRLEAHGEGVRIHYLAQGGFSPAPPMVFEAVPSPRPAGANPPDR